MPPPTTTPAFPSPIGSIMVLAALLLSGCTTLGLAPPHQSVSIFTTNQQVALRSSQADDSAVVAVLPKGTPVSLDGRVGSECVCWKVDTPEGTGWVYTWFLDMHLTDIGP
jgi:hypothetical protein